MAVSFNPFTGNLEMGGGDMTNPDVQTMSVNGVEIIDSNRVLSNVTLSGITVDAGEY
jgi:hypothetical protein